MAFNVKLYVAPFDTTQEAFDGIMEDYTLPEGVDIRTETTPSGALRVSAHVLLTEDWVEVVPTIIARNNTKSEADLAKWQHLIGDVEYALSDDLIREWAENILESEYITVVYAGVDDDDIPIGGSYSVDDSGDISERVDIFDIYD